MKRGRSTGKPTKAEAVYIERAKALGCVICRFRIANGMQDAKWGQCGSTHYHHRNFNDWHGGKRLGHAFGVALGAWHHDGRLEIEWPPMGSEEMREVYGPSFKHAKDFRAWTDDVLSGYGRGTEAWQRYQDELMEESRD